MDQKGRGSPRNYFPLMMNVITKSKRRKRWRQQVAVVRGCDCRAVQQSDVDSPYLFIESLRHCASPQSQSFHSHLPQKSQNKGTFLSCACVARAMLQILYIALEVNIHIVGMHKYGSVLWQRLCNLSWRRNPRYYWMGSRNSEQHMLHKVKKGAI